jgi:methylglyoxal/glyoxal reductase
MPASPLLTLNNGIQIPVLGLGVYQMPDNSATQKVLEYAVKIGYRHFDTAMIYGNERSVGRAANAGIVPRDQLFITTKVWNSDHGYDQAIKAFNKSLDRLGTGYIDLYLIHWPVQGKRKETWKALETLYEEGKCRSIGISNYMAHHIEELMGYCKVIPAINQLELHPYIYGDRLDTLAMCRKHNIVPEAYSPLTKGQKLKDPVLVKMASKYNKNPAHLLLRWCIQNGFVVIPKSSVTSRIAENLQVFDFTISDEDMQSLNHMNENLATGWDPTNAN